MRANASTTAAFRGGKVSSDAAMTSSAERPPALIVLVPIVAFAFMMMVVDSKIG